MENQSAQPKKTIKSLYFYLVSFVALMMVVFSSADLINIALKIWIFTKADDFMFGGRVACETLPAPVPDPKATNTPSKEQVIKDCEAQNKISEEQAEASRVAQRQNSVVRDISMIVVGIPLFLIHWNILRRKDENL